MSGQGSVGGSSAGPGSARNNGSVNVAKRSLSRRKLTSESGSMRRSSSLSKSTGERTVKKLRLSKALTIPDGTTVADACRRMATRRVDAALLTDSSALLCGIITDKDIATRVIAEGLRPEDTPVSRVMTRNPVFVMSETSAVDALQKMVQGKFRHLPVVENGEVVALLDITKCLYDAIARMERAAEKGNAIAAAVEDVERQWGNGMGAPSTVIETLRERMYRPTVGSLITEGAKVATVVPSDSVFTAAQKMRDFRVSSVVVTSSNKPQGILTSKDILLHVVAPGLSPEITTVDKVMTPNPECASPETTIVDALHTMHDGKFLHLPVVNQDGQIIACLDVLQLTHGAVATVGNAGDSSDISSTMMQKFWDSAFAMEPPEDDEDTRSNFSATMTSDVFGSEAGRPTFSLAGPPNSFSFKLKDRSGRVHRFNCGTESLTELMSAIVQRLGDDIDRTKVPQVMYEDDEGDRVLLSSDSDLIAAVSFARTTNLKGLRLYLDYSNSEIPTDPVKLVSTTSGLQTVVIGCTVAVIGVGLILYLRRANPGFVSKLL